MKKLLAFVLILVCVTSSAAAEYTIPKEDHAAIRFNAYGENFGAPTIDAENAVQMDDLVIFPMEGYDIIFMFDQNEKIRSAGIRLKDESAAGNFLLSCMTIVSSLSTIDYEALGMILFQYGQIRSGKEESIPYRISGDEFMIQSGPDGFICLFAYANTNNEKW